jgi:hypothetical protein
VAYLTSGDRGVITIQRRLLHRSIRRAWRQPEKQGETYETTHIRVVASARRRRQAVATVTEPLATVLAQRTVDEDFA